MDSNSQVTKAKFKAYIGYYVNFWSYLNDYQNAFNVLVDSVDAGNSPIDTVAYPMLFIARHSLELGFKANIQYFKKYSEKKDYTNSDSHNLKDLFCGFKIHIDATVKNLKAKHDVEVEKADMKEFYKYCEDVEKLTLQFDVLDQGSYSFRYPVDKKSNVVFKHTDTVDLLDIKEVFDKSMILLRFTAAVFAKYTDYVDYMENMYEEEMRSAYGPEGYF
jgi:hypothetical protein